MTFEEASDLVAKIRNGGHLVAWITRDALDANGGMTERQREAIEDRMTEHGYELMYENYPNEDEDEDDG